jgi:hypothetical protein
MVANRLATVKIALKALNGPTRGRWAVRKSKQMVSILKEG